MDTELYGCIMCPPISSGTPKFLTIEKLVWHLTFNHADKLKNCPDIVFLDGMNHWESKDQSAAGWIREV